MRVPPESQGGLVNVPLSKRCLVMQLEYDAAIDTIMITLKDDAEDSYLVDYGQLHLWYCERDGQRYLTGIAIPHASQLVMSESDHPV